METQSSWPARSPDFHPLDFWLWELLKPVINSDTINDLEAVEQRITVERSE